LRIDATFLKERRGGRVLSTAVIVAVGVDMVGKREVLGVETPILVRAKDDQAASTRRLVHGLSLNVPIVSRNM
jgi:transposase-like protein